MSGPAVSTRPARSYKAAADILSERDPVLRRLVAQAVHEGEGWHRGAIEPLLVIREADHWLMFDLHRKEIL